MGMAASSAMIKRTTIWNVDTFESSAFPMMRKAINRAIYIRKVLIQIIIKATISIGRRWHNIHSLAENHRERNGLRRFFPLERHQNDSRYIV